jgi:hypothetical protein
VILEGLQKPAHKSNAVRRDQLRTGYVHKYIPKVSLVTL